MAIGGKTLTVYLAADVSKLRGGLAQAETGLAGFSNKLTSMIGPALIGATAAAGAFAVALGVDSVQAAMAEEAELAKLNTTLDNLGFSGASEQLNQFVDDLQFATGTADSVLRPALERLLISTNNVAQSQKLLSIALDVSAGTGKSLESVANALGKAYDGNFGALSKLNAGIDSSIIKNKDLDGAIQALSTTFGGQAAAQAQTLQGQIKILNVAFDELKEALGKGLIEGFTSTGGGLGNLSIRMRALQPQTEDLGQKAGILAGNLLDAALGAKTLADRGNELLQGILSFGGPAFELIGNAAIDALNPIGQVINSLAQMNQALTPGGTSGGVSAFGTGGAMARATASVKVSNSVLTKAASVHSSLAKASGGASKAIEQMNPRLREQIDLVKSLTSQLDSAGKALETARKDMNDWIDSLAGKITAGIDLGAAFTQQSDVNAAGEKIGVSLLEGFQRQIDQAGIFGSYLQTLDSQGGPELRDAVASLGPEIGNKLAKQIIDEGLVKTFQEKLVTVKDAAQTTASTMVPEFLIAGVNSAAGYLMGLQSELASQSAMLEEMGRAMGKTLTDAMVKEIRDALTAAGIAQTGSSNILAGVPANALSPQAQVAQYIDNPFMNSQAIGQAIQRVINNSNARSGYATDLTIPR